MASEAVMAAAIDPGQDLIQGLERTGHLEIGELSPDPVTARASGLHRTPPATWAYASNDRRSTSMRGSTALACCITSGGSTKDRYGREAKGPQQVSLLLEAIGGPLLQCAMRTYVGHVIEPVAGLTVEILVRREGPAVEKARTDVAHRAFDLALGLGPVGTTRSDPEVPVMREAQKLGVLSDATSGRSLILSDDSLHLVEQQFMRHTTKEAERRLEALEDMLHRLSNEELQPQDARKPPAQPGTRTVCPRGSRKSAKST